MKATICKGVELDYDAHTYIDIRNNRLVPVISIKRPGVRSYYSTRPTVDDLTPSVTIDGVTYWLEGSESIGHTCLGWRAFLAHHRADS